MNGCLNIAKKSSNTLTEGKPKYMYRDKYYCYSCTIYFPVHAINSAGIVVRRAELGLVVSGYQNNFEKSYNHFGSKFPLTVR